MSRASITRSARPTGRRLPAVGAVAAVLVAWLAAWAIAAAVLLSHSRPQHSLGWTLWLVASAALGLVALIGVRQLAYLVAAARRPVGRSRARQAEHAPVHYRANSRPRVAILYPVADDFRAEAVRASAAQTHPGTRVVVLDDSRGPDARLAIEKLARESAIEVHRRAGRDGAKAGNINAWLDAHGHEVDYVVVLDADQIAEATFVERALARASADPSIAIVQGTVRARASETDFSRDLAQLFDLHASVQLRARAVLGVDSFTGRGALIDVAALREVGGFPALVMEDTALTVALAQAGRRVVAAPEAVSVEDAPIDHAAFAVQFGKFTEGAVQLLGRSAGALFDRRVETRRRIDLLLELLVPVAAATVPGVLFLYSLVALATYALPLPWQVGVVLGVLGFLPLVPSVAARARERGLREAVLFGARASLLYASVAVAAARALARVAVSGGAEFRITPKKRADGGYRDAFRRCTPEILVATGAVLLGAVGAGDPAVALPFVGIAAAAIGFGLRDAHSARKLSERRDRAGAMGGLGVSA